MQESPEQNPPQKKRGRKKKEVVSDLESKAKNFTETTELKDIQYTGKEGQTLEICQVYYNKSLQQIVSYHVTFPLLEPYVKKTFSDSVLPMTPEDFQKKIQDAVTQLKSDLKVFLPTLHIGL